MKPKTFSLDDLRVYRALVEEQQEAKARLREIEAQIKAIEVGQGVSHVPAPARLRDTIDTLRALGGRAVLDQIFRRHAGGLTRQGVRSQLLKLIELRIVRKTGRGEFELIKD